MNFEEQDYSVSASSSSSSGTADPSSPTNCDSVSNYNLSSNEATSQLVSHKKRAGRKKFKETRHPIYRGVRQRKNQWVCEVREPNKKTRIWLGTHPTPEMAARAYDVAAIALRGMSAPLNFKDSLWVLPRAKSSLAKDIQMAALEGVEAFRPNITSSSLASSSQSSNSRRTVKSTPAENESNMQPQSSSTPFVDEEELFNMPGLLTSMAEGMLISPPEFQKDLNFDDDMDESHSEFTLWS